MGVPSLLGHEQATSVPQPDGSIIKNITTHMVSSPGISELEPTRIGLSSNSPSRSIIIILEINLSIVYDSDGEEIYILIPHGGSVKRQINRFVKEICGI